jgi:hypothetical protein
MRYGKKKVNKILNEVLAAVYSTELGVEHNHKFLTMLELIKEEHLLVDRRVSSLPEYTTAIIIDFIEYKLSYKDIMKKYHCSQRSLIGLLVDCAEGDGRVRAEIEFRRH